MNDDVQDALRALAQQILTIASHSGVHYGPSYEKVVALAKEREKDADPYKQQDTAEASYSNR